MNYRDANTKIFNAALKQKRSSNCIAHIKIDDGSWFEEEEEIKESFVQYYSSLFVEDRDATPPSVSPIQRYNTSIDISYTFSSTKTAKKY